MWHTFLWVTFHTSEPRPVQTLTCVTSEHQWIYFLQSCTVGTGRPFSAAFWANWARSISGWGMEKKGEAPWAWLCSIPDFTRLHQPLHFVSSAFYASVLCNCLSDMFLIGSGQSVSTSGNQSCASHTTAHFTRGHDFSLLFDALIWWLWWTGLKWTGLNASLSVSLVHSHLHLEPPPGIRHLKMHITARCKQAPSAKQHAHEYFNI